MNTVSSILRRSPALTIRFTVRRRGKKMNFTRVGIIDRLAKVQPLVTNSGTLFSFRGKHD